MSLVIIVIAVVVVAYVVLTALLSINVIGPTQVGLVQKRFSLKKLPEDNPIAFHGEAGYQAELLTPGLRFKLWPIFGVKRFPWVQIPAGEIGVVIAQVGAPLPIGAKSARVQDGVRELLAPRQLHRRGRPEGCAAAGVAARHPAPDPPGRVLDRDVAQGLRHAGVTRPVGAGAGDRRRFGPSPSGSRRSNCRWS